MPARPADRSMASRMLTLGASLAAALCAGTNYIQTIQIRLIQGTDRSIAYAPQLGSRLGLSHTNLNVIGLAGNYGAQLSSPLWGRIIDSNGPRLVLLSACFFQFFGYYGTKVIYDLGPPPGAREATIPLATMMILVGCKALTGAGGNAGIVAGVNATAKSFPGSLRATTVGIVLSGFGLSALLFSTIGRVFLAGRTSSFLTLLAFGTSVPMVFASFFVRAVPPPMKTKTKLSLEEAEEDPKVCGEEDPLLASSSSDDDTQREEEVNVHGVQLAKSLDFWLLFTITSLLAGSGLTYINNVGSMARALYAHSHSSKEPGSAGGYDPREADLWQGHQVSVISVASFSGRLLIGPISDLLKTHLSLPPSYLLLPISLLTLLGQLTLLRIERVEEMWVASAISGWGYGSLYVVFPGVCIEWFGMAHFSENSGYIALSPIISSNIFAFIFGRIMDAHTPTSTPKRLLTAVGGPGGDAMAQCLEGKRCYSDAVHYTAIACLVAVGLSVWAAWRDRRRVGRL